MVRTVGSGAYKSELLRGYMLRILIRLFFLPNIGNRHDTHRLSRHIGTQKVISNLIIATSSFATLMKQYTCGFVAHFNFHMDSMDDAPAEEEAPMCQAAKREKKKDATASNQFERALHELEFNLSRKFFASFSFSSDSRKPVIG